MKVLGIESSCDETAAAVVENGRTILSNVIATQIPFHEMYSGVVPEIASRKHAEWILPVVCRALDEAGLKPSDVDAVAVGEAFDKVAKFYGFGYPGGVIIDKLAKNGDENAATFPLPSLHKGEHRYDVSYSGLKTAAINQLAKFWNAGYKKTPENIAAAFQKAAVQILLSRLFKAAEDTGLKTVVAGGGVAANSRLRALLAERSDLHCIFPPLKLCTDNGAMIAGVGYRYLQRGETSSWNTTSYARVDGFKRSGSGR